MRALVPYPLLLMPKTITRRITASCVIATCFVAGFGGAHSGAALETRAAVTQARATAHAISSQAQALNDSLARAESLIRASAFAADDPSVRIAAHQVERATELAAGTEDQHQAVLISTAASALDPFSHDNADPGVAQVLTGQTESPAAANHATEKLELVRADLEHARTEVDNHVNDLVDARSAVKHRETLADLDVAVERSAVRASAASTILTHVGENVADHQTLEAASQAVAELRSAIATAEHAHRDLTAELTERIGQINQAQGVLDARLASLQLSHELWVNDENEAISASNHAAQLAHAQLVDQALEEHIHANRQQVAAHSNGWSGQPAGTTGANGRLSWDHLCELDFAPQHRLQCDAAAALMAANEQYSAETGRDLVLTDSYRSYSLQVRTRALKPRTAARPGTSNHGWGMAIDMDHESATWLTDHGADFGWVHPNWARPSGSRPEWWHLEYVAADVGQFTEPAATDMTELVVSVFDPDYIHPSIDTQNTALTSTDGSLG